MPSDDRWPWPSNNVGIARPATIESAADALQGAATTVARAVDKPAQSRPAPVASTGGVSSPLIIKKSVPKPYRILSHVSSCPKLFHDLSLSCQMTQQQQQGQPLVSWLSFFTQPQASFFSVPPFNILLAWGYVHLRKSCFHLMCSNFTDFLPWITLFCKSFHFLPIS